MKEKVTLTNGSLDERIRYFLDDKLVCLRVWDAWGVGTMTEDDFVSVAEDEDQVNDLKTLIAVEVDPLRAALEKMIGRYRELVLSGDCGNWNPDTEDFVIEANKALGNLSPTPQPKINQRPRR